MNSLKHELIDLLLNLPGIDGQNNRPVLIQDLVSPDMHKRIDWQGNTHAFVTGLVALLAKNRNQLLGFLDQLANSNWLDIERPLLIRELGQEIATLSPQQWFQVFGISDWTQWALPDCPYRGLHAFQTQDKDLFFGRQKSIVRLLGEVKAKQLVAVIGSSGSGKSSLVFAGLIPQLPNPESWNVVSFRPGKNPFDALAGALLGRSSNLPAAREIQELARQLQQDKDALQKYIAPGQRTLLLVADQFEELYTLCSVLEMRERFLDRLLAAVHNAPAFKLVLTMRADFYHYALRYRPFVDALQNACFNLGPMNREELEDAIARPAESRGVSLEKGLVERILEDIHKKPDEEDNSNGNSNQSKQPPDKLPLLEFALKQLWEEAAKNKYPELTNEAYSSIGGVKKALANYAEKIYADLLQGQQDGESYEQKQIQQVFIQLVRPGEETGTEDTRRLAMRSDIRQENWDLVARLNREDVRLLVIGRDDVTETETVEVVHEVLISGWSRLTGWMNANRAFRTWQERLRGALRQWESSDKDRGALLRGVPLAEAEGWLSQREEDINSREEREFIRESVRWRDRENKKRKRRQQRTFFGLFGGFVTVSLLAAVAMWQGANAEKRAEIANLKIRFAATQDLDALIGGIELGKKLKKANWAAINTRIQGIDMLREMVYWQGFKEYNSLDKHTQQVNSVAFSHDGKFIASASTDKTAKVWREDGTVKTTLKGHVLPIYRVTFGNHLAYGDEELIATASEDTTAKIWKLDGTLVATLEHDSRVYRVAFSPKQDLIVTATDDGTVKFWKFDGSLFQAFKEHKKHSQAVWEIAFTRKGNLIATASLDGTAKLWKYDGSFVTTLKGHSDEVKSVAFSPNGNLIATASHDGTVKLWTSDGSLFKTLEGHKDKVYSVVFSPDGSLIASASYDNNVILWKPDGQLVYILEGHSDNVFSVDFNNNGSLIATAGADDTIKLWKPNGDLVDTLEGHNNVVYKAAFNPKGNLIVSASADKTVKFWKYNRIADTSSFSPNENLIVSAGDKTVRFRKYNPIADTVDKYPCRRIAFSPKDNLIALACDNGKLYILNSEALLNYGPRAQPAVGGADEDALFHGTKIRGFSFSPPTSGSAPGAPIGTFGQSSKKLFSLAFSPKEELIATGNRVGTIELWGFYGSLVRSWKGHKGPIYDIAFSSNGDLIATAGSDKTVTLWKLNGKEVENFHELPDVTSVAFSPKEDAIAIGSHHSIKLQRYDDTTFSKNLTEHSAWVRSVAFSPKGNIIASASQDWTVKLWRSNGTLFKNLTEHSGIVTNVTFSPKGNLIASTSQDKTVKLWNSNDGTLVHTFLGHKHLVESLAFSPNGDIIATISDDNTLKLWNLNLDDLLVRGCDWVRDYINTLPDNDENKHLCDDINTNNK